MFAFPPVGSARTLSQTRHLTTVAHLLNIICSFLHFSHLTLRNLLASCMTVTQVNLAVKPLKRLVLILLFCQVGKETDER